MIKREMKEKIENASAISILIDSHCDVSIIGIALGMYALLKENQLKRVEVVNTSMTYPLRFPVCLDFLPYAKKIKAQRDYDDSLMITFDIKEQEHILIDTQNGCTSFLVYTLFKDFYDISVAVAECFYTALFLETKHFTTASVNAEIFMMAHDLLEKGVKPDKVAYHLTQRKSLASLRILERGLASLRLYEEAKIALLLVTKEDKIASGAMLSDMEGIVEYGKALSTVEIAVCLIEIDEGIRVYLGSKRIDIRPLVMAFTASGHEFTLENTLLAESIQKVLVKIKELGMLNGI